MDAANSLAVLPPLVKLVLHKQHNQSDKNVLINLAKESYSHSHSVAFQPPPKTLWGCVAFGRNRSERSRNALGSRTRIHRLNDRQPHDFSSREDV